MKTGSNRGKLPDSGKPFLLMNPQDRRQNDNEGSEVGEAFSPRRVGEGRAEGGETLRKPAQWRTADGVDYTERRKAKLHASQNAEALAVASPLPPHPAPLPQGEGTPHHAMRRVEALRIGESAADDSPSPRGEGWGEGEETLRKPGGSRTSPSPALPARSSRRVGEEEAPPAPGAVVAYTADPVLIPR
jgi:hypothetical protein